MIQKITQNNWNFWTVNYASKKIVNQSSDFPVRRTGSYRHKKALHSVADPGVFVSEIWALLLPSLFLLSILLAQSDLPFLSRVRELFLENLFSVLNCSRWFRIHHSDLSMFWMQCIVEKLTKWRDGCHVAQKKIIIVKIITVLKSQ